MIHRCQDESIHSLLVRKKLNLSNDDGVIRSAAS